MARMDKAFRIVLLLGGRERFRLAHPRIHVAVTKGNMFSSIPLSRLPGLFALEALRDTGDQGRALHGHRAVSIDAIHGES
jgi:hypothetical protein